MNKLDYFKGKVCTILTAPANRFFDENQYANIFFGLVEEIDHLGIWVIQIANNKKRSFFTLHSLVGIIEESLTVFKNEEEAQQVRKQLEAQIPPKNPEQLISVESLKKLKDKK